MPKKLIKNRNVRLCRLNARVNNTEMQEILTKAHLYCGGDVSKYVRKAALEFKPLKRVTK
jgi:hypothetical protein